VIGESGFCNFGGLGKELNASMFFNSPPIAASIHLLSRSSIFPPNQQNRPTPTAHRARYKRRINQTCKAERAKHAPPHHPVSRFRISCSHPYNRTKNAKKRRTTQRQKPKNQVVIRGSIATFGGVCRVYWLDPLCGSVCQQCGLLR